MLRIMNKRSLVHKIVILFCLLFACMFQTTVYGANFELQKKKKTQNKPINPSEIVKVTTRGEGKDRDEAINMALRDALERTNQSFVSSVSLFSDDEISYDEIARVSKGNIAKFDVIYGGLDEQGQYSVLVDAYVSATNLADYVENQGGSVRIKGFDFVQNHMQKLKLALFYKENELTAIYNLFIELCQFSGKMYDYSIESSDPKVDSDNKHVNMSLLPRINQNDNYKRFRYCLEKTLNSLSIPDYEIDAYKSLNLGGPYYYRMGNGFSACLRNQESVNLLEEYIKIIEKYGKYDYVIENNLGKRIKVNNESDVLNYNCTIEEFSNLESFSIIPSSNPVSFAICKDTLANIVEKVRVGFSGFRLIKKEYPNIAEHDSKVSGVINSDYLYESRRQYAPPKNSVAAYIGGRSDDYKIYCKILAELDNTTLTLSFYSPNLYDYSVQGNSVKVWETFEMFDHPVARNEATITRSSGIGFLNSWMPTEKTKVLRIMFENGDVIKVNTSSKLSFESFVFNKKKCVRPVICISIPLDHLDIEKYNKYSYAERKMLFSRQLCLYKITSFHIDTNELCFKHFYGKFYYDRNLSKMVYNPMKRTESGDKKGFYPQNTPDIDFFLNLFYKKGAKDNSLESYGLAKVIGF